MTERSPTIPTIQPFFAEAAIAQAVDNKSVIAVPSQPQPNSNQPPDAVSLLGYVALGVTALWGVGSQLIAKAGTVVIAAKEKKINQELSQDAAINDGYVRQADKSFEALISLLNTAIGNILQTSRESKEIFYLGHDKVKENTKAIEQLQSIIEQNSKDIAKILQYQKDIMSVLNMKERGQ